MRRSGSAAIFAAAGLALVGCAGVDRINHVTYDGYSAADLGYAVGNGEVPVRVLGAPAEGLETAAVARRIGEAMHGANPGPVVNYGVYDGTSPAGYIMTVRFGQAAPARDICADDAPSGVGTDYAAAFCKDGKALSYLAGNAGSADIASDGFRRAMAGAATQLLPLENPNYEDDDDGSWVPSS